MIRKAQKKEVGGGTGLFISSDGLIITNRHVVSDESADYTALTNDGKKYQAKILAKDSMSDISLIKIEVHKFSSLILGNSDQLKLRQIVLLLSMLWVNLGIQCR
ncbi:MAG: trypsin-like peptidase domain-containing protein [Thermoprotei archaeon]